MPQVIRICCSDALERVSIVISRKNKTEVITQATAARLAQVGEGGSAEREAVGSNPGRTNTQGL